jgi:hypothetical protein
MGPRDSQAPHRKPPAFLQRGRLDSEA